jgi:hypothetical protein
MNAPLIFLVAPAPQLPAATTSLEELQRAQATGPSTGFALRIFSRGAAHPDLGLLPVDGGLTGEQRRSSDRTLLLCDALVVQIDPQHHRLGVYQGDPEDPTAANASNGRPNRSAPNRWRPGDGSRSTTRPTTALRSRIASQFSQLRL